MANADWYLVVLERQEASLQQVRRLAVHGIDVGPRLVHSVQVTA